MKIPAGVGQNWAWKFMFWDTMGRSWNFQSAFDKTHIKMKILQLSQQFSESFPIFYELSIDTLSYKNHFWICLLELVEYLFQTVFRPFSGFSNPRIKKFPDIKLFIWISKTFINICEKLDKRKLVKIGIFMFWGFYGCLMKFLIAVWRKSYIKIKICVKFLWFFQLFPDHSLIFYEHIFDTLSNSVCHFKNFFYSYRFTFTQSYSIFVAHLALHYIFVAQQPLSFRSSKCPLRKKPWYQYF